MDPQFSAVPQPCAKCGQPLGSVVFHTIGGAYHPNCQPAMTTSPADIQHRLRGIANAFDGQTMPIDGTGLAKDLREAADTIAQLVKERDEARDAQRKAENGFNLYRGDLMSATNEMDRQHARAEAAEAEAATLREALSRVRRIAGETAVGAVRLFVLDHEEFPAGAAVAALQAHYEQKAVYNALTYLTRTNELQRTGYGAYRRARAQQEAKE
jgi:hypothetical protein